MCGLLLQFYTAVLQITCWFILHHKQVSAMLWVIHVGVMWMSRMGRIVDFSLINKNSFGKWDINSRVIFLFFYFVQGGNIVYGGKVRMVTSGIMLMSQ